MKIIYFSFIQICSSKAVIAVIILFSSIFNAYSEEKPSEKKEVVKECSTVFLKIEPSIVFPVGSNETQRIPVSIYRKGMTIKIDTVLLKGSIYKGDTLKDNKTIKKDTIVTDTSKFESNKIFNLHVEKDTTTPDAKFFTFNEFVSFGAEKLNKLKLNDTLIELL